MDQVRIRTRANEAADTHGVTGRGVTVAILDRGIDWRHPDFRHPNGTTRIKWLLDMSGQQGCPGSPAPVEYTEGQINDALFGGATLLTDDFVGHGTVTAGLAAGNGTAFAAGRYRGMAPEADLVIVKLVSDGAPAHDGIPAETSFAGCLSEALEWVEQKVRLLGQPAVATANIGTQYGPMDGTSAVSRQIDDIFGLDRPGRVFVAPPGDEGGLANHAGGTFDDTSETIVRFTKATEITTYTTLWYTGAVPATVAITFDDGVTVGPVGPNQSQTAGGISIFHYLPGQDFWRSTSGDRAVVIVTRGHTGGGGIRIRGMQPGTGTFDLYGDISGPTFLGCNVCFSDHPVAGRLTDLASTRSAVVSAVVVNRQSYVDVDGVTRVGFGDAAGPGTLWPQSPGGPTRDGRLGVDVALPGDSVFAAYGQRSWWTSDRRNLIADGGGWYGRGGGGSGSGPITTGAVALMLQLNPRLTARQVKQILHDSAVADSSTGPVPNPGWGYGTLDMLGAMDRVARTITRVAAAVLPTSRAVQLGATATAFATVVATGVGPATDCSIAPSTAIPTDFFYQMTDRDTNLPIGQKNTPVTIAPGAFQTFMIGFTPTAVFPATELHLAFDCTNTPPAPDTPGVNTFLLTSASSPTPDIVALAAAVGGTVTIPGPTGTGVLAVASMNIGADAPITVTADTGSASLPVTLALCQTNPATGLCINPTTPAPSVTAQINHNDTATFTIFARASGTIPFNPGLNRINARFKTQAGGTVGSTSAAMQTQ